MNVLEKILEEIKQYTEDVYECDLDDIVEYQRRNREDNCTYIVQGIEEATEFIRSHMDEASDMHGKRLIDANALDEEVRNFFFTIIGDPSQAMVVRECKESFRRIIDEQPTVYEANDWISVSEKGENNGKV